MALRQIKTCNKCEKTKPVKEFYRDDTYKDGLRSTCRECASARKLQWYHDNHKKSLALSQKYRAQNPNKMRDYRLKIKIEVMTHYCNGNVPSCQECGFSDIRVLCIDHIDGRGSEHRLKLTSNDPSKQPRDGGGFNTYMWLRRNHYPTGFQVLCFNCNQIKECEQRDSRLMEQFKNVSA